MTSNFTAAELRDLADKLRLPLRNQDHVKTEDDASDALREYATLIDTVLDGGDVVTDEIVDAFERAFDINVDAQYIEHAKQSGDGVYRVFHRPIAIKAALTAALPAIRLRLLADTAKEGT